MRHSNTGGCTLDEAGISAVWTSGRPGGVICSMLCTCYMLCVMCFSCAALCMLCAACHVLRAARSPPCAMLHVVCAMHAICWKMVMHQACMVCAWDVCHVLHAAWYKPCMRLVLHSSWCHLLCCLPHVPAVLRYASTSNMVHALLVQHSMCIVPGWMCAACCALHAIMHQPWYMCCTPHIAS
jgi:hypothetical protein